LIEACVSICLCIEFFVNITVYEDLYLHEAHFVILYAHVLVCVYFRHVWCMCSKGMCMYLRYFWPNKQHSHKYTHATFQNSIANYCTIQYNTVEYYIVLYCTLLSIAVCDFEYSRSSVECWYMSGSDTGLNSLWLCVTKYVTLCKYRVTPAYTLCDTLFFLCNFWILAQNFWQILMSASKVILVLDLNKFSKLYLSV